MRQNHKWWNLFLTATISLTSFTTAQDEPATPTNATEAGMVFNLPIKNPSPQLNDDKTLAGTQLCSKCSLDFGGKAYNQSEISAKQFYINLSPRFGCELEDYDILKSIQNLPFSPDLVNSYQAFVLVKRGECNFGTRAGHLKTINDDQSSNYQNIHLTGVIHLSEGVLTPGTSNKTVDELTQVLVCSIDGPFFDKIVKNTQKEGEFYPFDYYKFRAEDFPEPAVWTSYIETAIIWALAMVSMICAAKYLQALENHKRKARLVRRSSDEDNSAEKVELIENDSEEEITVMKTVFMVSYASVFLVTLYFLYKYLVWLMLGLFVLMSAATFSLLLTNMAVMYAPKLLGSSQPSVDLGSCGSCSLFDFCTLGGGLTIGIIWFIFRHSSWSWVLQDLMGFAFCVTIPSQLKVTNLRTVSILFAAFFAYDVFMVFGTRLITSNGDSVMVEVATGGGTGEIIPMLFKVPKFSLTTYLKSCGSLGYSMLGFGDIIVPGIMTCLCVRFDLVCPVGRRKIYKHYTFWAIISYGFSLLVCFVALYIMKEGQPALLYINPIMVATICGLAALRGEFKIFWHKGLKLNDSSYKGRFKNWQVCAESGEDIPFNQSVGGSSSSRHVSAD